MTSGFAGFGGFGQNNNTNQTGGGFGSTFGQASNTTSGFGSTTNNAGFGSTTNTGGSLFSGTSGGFGGSGGGFGTSSGTAFGAKSSFGAPTSTGGGIFGNTTSTANTGAGFGGFGSGNATTASPFGGTNTGVGLFGSTNKPAFGNTSGTTSTPFGGATGFGSSSTPSAFGGAGTALGVAVGENQGTAAVPFQAHLEKEPNAANSQQQNAFQNIIYQQPYQKFSQEELRLADYAQGRRYGNASGQAGAFGQSANFSGGFGSSSTTNAFGGNNTSGTGLFGNTSGAGFGQTNQTTGTSFGSPSVGGGLFGTKPAASGGIFGAQTQPATGTAPSLFGATSGTPGFGNTGGNAFGSNTAGSLFTNSNQNKPFSFNNQTTSGGTPFGGNAAGTNAFGSTGGSLFGNNSQTQPTATPFGGNNQSTTSNPFGGFGGTTQTQTTAPSLFGNNNNNQPKPAGGLFGSSTNAATNTGIFGNANNTASTFGNTNNNQQGGSLFGASKPAQPLGGSLFGNTANNANTGSGGLFSGLGSNQNNQGQQGQNNPTSLFGTLNQQQPKPSLFGATQAQSNTGGLFGNSTNTQGGGSLFGNSSLNQQPQPQQGSLFAGLNDPQQSQQSQPGSLTASINDPTAFGTSMFANLGTPQVQNPGPLATPLSSHSRNAKSTPIPMHMMNPASAVSRYVTPLKQGFGFTYSTYGTPASASSTSSTPITYGNIMLGANFGRGLTKSVSTNSLRGSYNSSFSREDGILAPGAFSASPASRLNSTGSMKRLVINRGVKVDLFSPKEPTPPPGQGGILKKRVSFDSSTVGGSLNGTSSPLKQVQSSTTPSSEELGYLRTIRSTNGSANGSSANGVAPPPEMEQVKGNELAIVPEEETAVLASAKVPSKLPSQEDQEPGRYWMKPSKEEILNMNRAQRQKVIHFTVGREGVGQVRFDTPVDLVSMNLDEIFGKLVILNIRKATVYPEPSKKPPVGKGLNVPSTIELQNSWPRGRDRRNPSHEKAGPRFQKHIDRLAKVPDTLFRDYNKDTGVWTFTVQHFTTYGLEYDDDDEVGDATSEFGHSTLSAAPDTPTPQSRTPKIPAEVSFVSSDASEITGSDPEDTFDFKKKKILPGAFNDDALFEDDAEMQDGNQDSPSFLDDGSAGSHSEDGVEEPMDYDEYSQSRELVRIEDQEMAGSYPNLDDTAEHSDDYSQEIDSAEKAVDTPGAIVRARMRAMRTSGSPLKRKLRLDDDDWTEMLRQTVSPQKQDRVKLKQLNDSVSNSVLPAGSRRDVPPKLNTGGRVVSDGRGFATSIDLMHSLFEDTRSPVKNATISKSKGFEWPYAKQSKASGLGELDINETEKAFHNSLKPNWDANGTIVYAAPEIRSSLAKAEDSDRDGLLIVQKRHFSSEFKGIHFARFSNESSAAALKKQKSITTVTLKGGIPYASLPFFKFGAFFEDRTSGDQATAHEKLVWELAGVLFDPIDVPDDLKNVANASSRLRKENLTVFWQKLVTQALTQHVVMAKSNEEKAIACLSGHRIPEACGHLLNGKDFRLATLVASIDGNEQMKRDIREQLTEWQKSRVLSEFSQPTRTIYELLAGNVCVCDGSKGAPVEDRMETFIISKRFGFDWRQAFGLRLWYAILSSDDFARAVQMFNEDLAQEKESARPRAWYVEQGIAPLWNDQGLERREDLLWGLLKLYADRKTDLESVLRPENSQLSPLNVRLSWQLSRALLETGNGSYGADSNEKSDQLTLSFASQLTSEGNWLDAVFALLHLSSAPARAKAIQDHLAHHAGRIGPEDGQPFTSLTQEFRIPSKWIWEAKALFMRSVQKDPKGEVECLIRAGAFDEAHRTFAKQVAPKTIIERDWDTLRSLLTGFNGREHHIAEWHLGGELYSDYLMLIESQKKGLKIDAMLLERLLAVLPAVVDDGRHTSFIETVAVQEISSVVANIVTELAKRGNNKDLSMLMRLPLTEDMCLKHTVDLSASFYENLMASGR